MFGTFDHSYRGPKMLHNPFLLFRPEERSRIISWCSTRTHAVLGVGEHSRKPAMVSQALFPQKVSAWSTLGQTHVLAWSRQELQRSGRGGVLRSRLLRQKDSKFKTNLSYRFKGQPGKFYETLSHTHTKKKTAMDIAQWLGAIAALEEDPDSSPSTHKHL